MTTTAAALAGVKVLDLTQVGAGPYCTTLLGDFGAEVVHVEPLGGEPNRRTDNFFAPSESSFYYGFNRSKKAVGIDIKSAAGRGVVERLVKWADVVTISMRPATAERLGLSYEALSAIKEDIIYFSITAFGESGPRVDLPGMDILAQALSGMTALTGEKDGVPVKAGASIADWATSFLGAFAICAALRVRDRDGIGQKLSISLLDAALSCLPQFISSYLATGREPVRAGNGHPAVTPYQSFATEDGNLVVACLDDRFWSRLCEALEIPEFIDDPRYATNVERTRNRDEVLKLVGDRMRTAPTAVWEKRFSAVSMPYAPVLTIPEVVEDPQVLHNGMILTLKHPKFGPYQVVNNPVNMSRTPAEPRGYSPGVGEHTREVLAEVGYSEAELARLRESNVIEIGSPQANS